VSEPIMPQRFNPGHLYDRRSAQDSSSYLLGRGLALRARALVFGLYPLVTHHDVDDGGGEHPGLANLLEILAVRPGPVVIPNLTHVTDEQTTRLKRLATRVILADPAGELDLTAPAGENRLLEAAL
jgi:hypothetical protein